MKDRIVKWLLPLVKALKIEARVLDDLRDVERAENVKEGKVYRYLGELVVAVPAKDKREPNVTTMKGVNVSSVAGGDGEVVTEGCCLECDLYRSKPCPRCKDGMVYRVV